MLAKYSRHRSLIMAHTFTRQCPMAPMSDPGSQAASLFQQTLVSVAREPSLAIATTATTTTLVAGGWRRLSFREEEGEDCL